MHQTIHTCIRWSGGLMCDSLLQGHAQLDVWSEVVQPFNLMPRFALEGTSNAVMGALVGGLLPRFMDRSAASLCTSLAADLHIFSLWLPLHQTHGCIRHAAACLLFFLVILIRACLQTWQ